MIMVDLNSRERFDDISSQAATAYLNAGPYWTTDFTARDGSMVLVFWTTNDGGSVSTVWEHTMFNLPNFGPTGAVRHMIPS